MKRLINEFIKNVKIMFRNWTSVSLLIIAPLVMILLIGYSFSSENVSGIKIGILDGSNTNSTAVETYLENSSYTNFENNKNFNETFMKILISEMNQNTSRDTEQQFIRNIEPLKENISDFGELIPYQNIYSCLRDLSISKIHLCVVLSNIKLNASSTGNLSEIKTGEVSYYYDSSRKKLSLTLIQNIQDFFGLKSEEMSIEETEGIISNIQGLIAFVNDRKTDIAKVKNESISIKQDLIGQKEQMIEVRAEFLPAYTTIKSLQKDINNYSQEIHEYSQKTIAFYRNDAGNIIGKINNITDELARINNINLSQFSINTSINNITSILNETTGNVSNNTTNNISKNISNIYENASKILDEHKAIQEEISRELNLIRNQTYDLGNNLLNLSNTINETDSKIQNMTDRINSIIFKIDLIKTMLDTQINKSDEYIQKIDSAIASIDSAENDLDKKLDSFNGIEKGFGTKLIKPINYNYETTLPNSKNIQLSFPFLAVMIIMFIAILFSNISTLMEIHNKAHQRNVIAPVNDMVYLFGMLATSTIIIFFQAMILFLVAQAKFGVNFGNVFSPLSLVVTLIILFFVLCGMLFAYISKTVQSSILITTFFALMLFIFGNTIAPLETMPGPAKLVSELNPIVIGEYLIREIQLYEMPLHLLLDKILIIFAYIIVLLGLVIFVSKKKNSKAY